MEPVLISVMPTFSEVERNETAEKQNKTNTSQFKRKKKKTAR